MPKEIVEVTDVIGQKVKIKFTKQEMCSCCRFSQLCNYGQEAIFISNDSFSLKKGDKIEIFVDEKKNMLANIIVFLLPIAIFVSMLVFLNRYGELNSFILAISTVCIYYLIMRLVLKKYEKKFQIKILRIVNNAG